MQSTSEFKIFYDKKLLTELNKVESKRKSILYSSFSIIAICVSLIPAIIWYLFLHDGEPHEFFYGGSLCASPLFFMIIYWARNRLVKNTSFYRLYKKNIIGAIIAHINPSLSYDNRKAISKKEYVKSGLFHVTKAADYVGDDHVSGKINEIDIEFSELVVKQKKDNDTSSKFNVQFQGIFFIAHLNESLPFNFVIEPINAEGKEPIVLINTLNDNFNSKFRIRLLAEAKEEDIQDYLSNKLLDSILNYSEQIHNGVYISFNYKEIFIGICHDKELFEPAIFSSNTSYDETFMHYKNLKFPISLIESIALNKELDYEVEN